MVKFFIKTQPNCKTKIKDIQEEFDFLASYEYKFNDELSRKIMQIIDNVLEQKGGYIKTSFGETSLKELSNGCKTLLLCNYYNNKGVAINGDEMGGNAVQLLLQLSNKLNISIFTKISFECIENIDNISCTLDGKKIRSYYELMERTLIQ